MTNPRTQQIRIVKTTVYITAALFAIGGLTLLIDPSLGEGIFGDAETAKLIGVALLMVAAIDCIIVPRVLDKEPRK